MVERKKPGVTFESFVDKQIREAQEDGAFDHLEGAGKPIPKGAGPHDELWWIKGYLQRENLSTDALLPESLQLRKELEKLPAVLIDLQSEDSVRTHLRDVNTRIVAWIRVPSPPLIPLAPVDVEHWVQQWKINRDARILAVRHAVATTPTATVPDRTWWWQRLFRRRVR